MSPIGCRPSTTTRVRPAQGLPIGRGGRTETLEGRRRFGEPRRLVSLGPKYKEWVLAPVHRRLRLFGSDLAESLTINYWYMVPSIWLPVTIHLIHIGYQRLRCTLTDTPGQSWSADDFSIETQVACSTVLGLLLWPLIEYTIHRWLFNMQPPDDWPTLIKVHRPRSTPHGAVRRATVSVSAGTGRSPLVGSVRHTPVVISALDGAVGVGRHHCRLRGVRFDTLLFAPRMSR